jgi:hypothetical protein
MYLNKCIRHISTERQTLDMPEAISILTHSDDKYWHKSLECLFEEINDQAQESVSILRQLRPDVIRELGFHPTSRVHDEILRFIDENCGPNTTQWTCTWAKIHCIVMVLNRNTLVLDCSDEDVAEDESSIHDEQEVECAAVEHETEEHQNEETCSDEDVKKIDLPVDADPIDGYFSKECQEANLSDIEDDVQDIETNENDDLNRENSSDSFIKELEKMDMIDTDNTRETV